MKKLLKPKDIFLFTLAGIGDLMEEARDPLSLVSSAYKNMYGFIPKRYTRNNFFQMVGRSLKTGDIEKVVKKGVVYLRLTSVGKNKVKRDFPIANLTKKWNKRWTILIFDIAEKSRIIRDSLRNKLRGIGFGMLQESVWITPLSIGKDLWELIESIGLKSNVFVMEVLDFSFSDPKELARRVWNLDRIENECKAIKNDIEMVNQLIEDYNDRYKLRMAKTPLKTVKTLKTRNSDHLYRLENRKRVLMGKYIQMLTLLPPLPKELLSGNLAIDIRKYGMV